MTKEELEKEAIKTSDKKCVKGCSKYYRYGFQDGYITGAEPREKQIQIDAEQIRALQKQNGELTDELTKKSDTNHRLIVQMSELNERCSELETQIEKMKSAVISERDEALRVEDIITYGVLNDIIDKWEIKDEQKETN